MVCIYEGKCTVTRKNLKDMTLSEGCKNLYQPGDTDYVGFLGDNVYIFFPVFF